jgi:CTP synthase (UTP-ammonia lyase)
MGFKQILILGDFDASSEAHGALQDRLAEAAERAGAVVNTRWLDADDLAVRPGAPAEAHGVVLAPRSTRAFRDLPVPYLGALRLVRERKIPFLATGDAHDLVLVEIARNVLGMERANSTYFDEEAADPVVKELPTPLRPLTNRRPRLMDVEVRDDPTLAPFLPAGRREEAARLTHGLNPDYGYAIEEAGLRVSGVDAVTGRPCLWCLDGAPWHVTAAFLPQLGGDGGAPHPLLEGFAAHVVVGR